MATLFQSLPPPTSLRATSSTAPVPVSVQSAAPVQRVSQHWDEGISLQNWRRSSFALGAVAFAIAEHRQRETRPRRHSRRLSSLHRRSIPDEWRQLPQKVRVNLANVTEEDLAEVRGSLDVFAPYRAIVLILGVLTLVFAMQNALFLLLGTIGGSQNYCQAFGCQAADDWDVANQVLVTFLAAFGVSQIWLATVYMAPPPLPTLEELNELLVEKQEGALEDNLEDLLDDLMPRKSKPVRNKSRVSSSTFYSVPRKPKAARSKSRGLGLDESDGLLDDEFDDVIVSRKAKPARSKSRGSGSSDTEQFLANI